MQKSKAASDVKPSVADRILRRLQGFADALERRAPIHESFTCHKIVLNLDPQSYTPRKVQQTRKLLGASQQIFAQFLGVSLGTVRSWEQGANPPQPIACRFMDEIRANPDYWLARLKKAAAPK